MVCVCWKPGLHERMQCRWWSCPAQLPEIKGFAPALSKSQASFLAAVWWVDGRAGARVFGVWVWAGLNGRVGGPMGGWLCGSSCRSGGVIFVSLTNF